MAGGAVAFELGDPKSRILITQQTRDASPEIPCRKVGGVIVKGKSEPIHVYEPLTGERAADENTKLYLAAFKLMADKDPGALAAFVSSSSSADLHSGSVG